MSDPLKDIAVDSKTDADPLVKYWGEEIRLALKREQKFRKLAEEVVKIYEVEDKSENCFNILYANTETLLPAIYNSSPRPVVERRFRDKDPLAKAAGETLERTLSYLLDTNSDEYEHIHALMRQAVLMALVPGRGTTWWKYDPKIQEAPPAAEEGKPDMRIAGTVFPSKGKVLWETICGEDVNYDDFCHGYARRWVDVPWVARRHGMTKDDCIHNFGKAMAEKLEYLKGEQKSKALGTSDMKEADEAKNQGSAETVEVFEVWDKNKKEVIFFAPTHKDALLKPPLKDPYGLPGFFPCYRPLHFLKKTSGLIPTPIYKAYEAQAKELNRITLRITRITNAMKVRGFYDTTMQGLQELLSKDDNTLIPAKNVAALQTGQNLQNSIWFMPLEILAKTLQELYVAQTQCRNTIYEITGIADIMRGDTQASETYGAQKIKDKWGTLRLQNMQGAVQNYVRGCLRICAQLAGKHFGMETFASMTNLDYATPEQVQQATQMQQAVQQQLMQMQQSQAMAGGPPPGAPPTGQPPQPPPVPPELQQAMQESQATLSKIKWEDVLGLLRNDILRQYRVDIETNSTLSDTSAEDKQNITECMTAIANTMASFQEPIQAGVFPMPAFKEILGSIVRRFEFGRKVEDAIDQIPDEVPPQEDPQAEAEKQKLVQDQQKVQQDAMKLEQDRTKFAQEQQQVQGKMLETHQAQEQDMAAREAALAQKEKEVSEQIASAIERVQAEAQKAQEKRDADEQKAEAERTKFMAAVEVRLAKSEMANEKRNAKTQDAIKADKTERESKSKVEAGERSLHEQKMGLTAKEIKLEKEKETPKDDSGMKAILAAQEKMMEAMGKLAEAVSKPRVMKIDRDEKGRAVGGSSTIQ